MNLPDGYSSRPAQVADVDAIVAVLHAGEVHTANPRTSIDAFVRVHPDHRGRGSPPPCWTVRRRTAGRG